MTEYGAVEEIYRKLSESLRKGAFPAGSRLPGERLLASRYHVSRATLRKALELLASEERVYASEYRGWFVPRQVLGEPPSVLQSFTEMAKERGLQATAHVLSRKVRPITLDEADRLHVAPGSDVFELRRLRGMDNIPICVDLNVIPLTISKQLVQANLENASLYRSLGTKCNVHVSRSTYVITAEEADEEMHRLLEIRQGKPLLNVAEIAWDQNEKPVLLGFNRYRGDAYRFKADLFRTSVP